AFTQNIRFNTYFRQKRPYIILKWAQTKDGFIARANFSSKWISSSASRQRVHQWRTQEDAILIGKHTALYDNPMLTSRDWKGKDPMRIVLDRNKGLPEHLKLFTDGKKTLVYTYKESEKKGSVEWIKLSKDGFYQDLIDDLYQRKIQSLIIEGGSQVLASFLAQGLWDVVRVFVGGTTFGTGIKAP
ncbi:unnamed protein product, partial [Chrysoparadoxa australica]